MNASTDSSYSRRLEEIEARFLHTRIRSGKI
jgi:hypothetical protein